MYRITVTLRDCPHTCYREIVVDDSISLHELSCAISFSFGWISSYRYNFTVDNKRMYGVDENYAEHTNLPYKIAFDVTVDEAFSQGKKLVYTFGIDHWVHDLKIKPIRISGNMVRLAGGKGCCPPDNCGGIPGYIQLLKDMKNPNSKEAKEWIEWLEDAPVHPQAWPKLESEGLTAKLNYFLMAGVELNLDTAPIFLGWLAFDLLDYVDPEDFV